MKIVIFLLSFSIFSVYLYTLHPTVAPYRDSGDLIVASYSVGIAHPPGYPLYVLTGKIFLLIFKIGNIAYRMNVMSAVCGALCIYVLGLCFINLFSKNIFVIFSLLLLAFSPAYWRLSQVSEMYSFNALLAAILLYITVKIYNMQQDNKYKYGLPLIYFLSFFSGFVLGNHQTILFVFPVIILTIHHIVKINKVHCLYCLLFFAAGLSIYLFLPIRSLTNPVSDWGSPKNLNSFLRLITRADYGGLRLHPEQSKFQWSYEIIFQHLYIYAKSLNQQFTWPVVFVGLYGIIIKIKYRYYNFLLISLLISGPFFIIFSNLPPGEKTTLPILEPHLMLPNLIFVLFVGAGIERAALSYTGKIFVLIVIFVSFYIHFPLCNYRLHYFAYDYGKNIMSTLPKNSLIYDPDDSTDFIISYMQIVNNKRPDIKLIAYFRTRWGYERMKKMYPELLPSYEIQSGMELSKIILDFNINRYSIFTEIPGKFPDGYKSYPGGLFYKLSFPKETAAPLKNFELYSLRNDYLICNNYDFFTNQIISYYAAAHNNIGLYQSAQKNVIAAHDEYLKALAIDQNLEAAYNNLGTLEYTNGKYKEAEDWFLQVLKLNKQNPSTVYNLGLACAAQNKSAEAELFLHRAWDTYKYADAGNELGLFALRKGEYSKSVEIFKSVIQYKPQYLLAYYNLGLALQKMSLYDESKKYFKYYYENVTDLKEKKEVLNIINNLSHSVN